MRALPSHEQVASLVYFDVELDGAGHFAWTDLNRTYISSINAYSVAFFDAYLKGQKDNLRKLFRRDARRGVGDTRWSE
jgi:hypothetical protein